MRRISVLVCSALVACLLLSVATPPLLAQGKEERALRSLIDRLIRAENSVDPAIVRQVFSEYSRVPAPIFPPYDHNAATVADLRAGLEASLAPLISRSLRATSPIAVSREGKLAWGSFELEAEYHFKDGSHQKIKGRVTMVFSKENTWKLKHWHGSLVAKLPAGKAANEADAQAVLDTEYASWNAYRDKQIDALAGSISEGFSTLIPDSAYRIQGKTAYLRGAEDWMAQNEMRTFQILDPKVEISGDTALLTYYFSFTATEGGRPVSAAGKATTIYKKDGERWMAWHRHASVNQAPPAPPQRDRDRDPYRNR